MTLGVESARIQPDLIRSSGADRTDTLRHIVQLNHPRLQLTVSTAVDLALLRIPKNASTSLVAHASFSFGKEFTPFAAFSGRAVAGIRDPEARFVSSIPETIKRFRLADVAETLHPAGNVVVGREVYDRLVSLDLRSPSEVIDEFLDLVSKGFFDAHHQPQAQFLIDELGDYLLDVELFDIKNVELVVRRLEADFGLSPSPIAKLNERETFRGRLRTRERIGLLKRRVLGREPWRPEQYIEQQFGVGHPVSRFALSQTRASDSYGYRWIEQCLGIFYRTLKDAYTAAPASLKTRVRDIYDDDVKLFRLVSESNDLFIRCSRGAKFC